MSMIGTIVRSASLHHRNFRKTSNLTYSVWKSVKCNKIHQNEGSSQDILIRFTSGPGIHGARLNTRYLTTSTTKTKEPSSKIEETVERLKEKKKAEPEVAKESEKVVKTSAATSAPVAKDETTTNVETPRKKTLWVRFKDEVKHYYSGFKLLYLDVNVSSKILLKLVRGKPLTRRESRQLVRTTSVIYTIYHSF